MPAGQRLKQTISFVAVPAGQPATLPHGMVVGSHGVKPDHLELQNPSFDYVSCDETNIVVQNNGANAGDCVVLAEHWHTFERSFGQLATGDETALSPQPFVIKSGSTPVSSGGGSVFVYRPGGVASGNVFTDWTLLMAACDLVAGPRIIAIDATLTPFPLVIPPGTWNMLDVTLAASNPTPFTQIRVPEGVVFTRLRKIQGIFIEWTGLTPPVADLQTLDIFEFTGPTSGGGTSVGAANNSAAVFASAGPDVSTGPFFRITGSLAVTISLKDASFLANFGALPLIELAGGGSVILSGGLGAFTTDDIVAGGVGEALSLSFEAGSATLTEQQPAMLGPIFAEINDRGRVQPRPAPFPDGTTTPFTTECFPQGNDLMRLDPTGGGGAVTMPNARELRGQTIIVKNVTLSANPITITAALGDTIDGLPAFVFGSPLGSVTLISDGVSNWMVV